MLFYFLTKLQKSVSVITILSLINNKDCNEISNNHNIGS